jgi:hypothetical protein
MRKKRRQAGNISQNTTVRKYKREGQAASDRSTTPSILLSRAGVKLFTTTSIIKREFGKAPCNAYHLSQSGCENQHCRHLHREISFSRNARFYYRQYLLGFQCKMPTKCRSKANGDCLYPHDCPDWEHCSTNQCPYDHPAEDYQLTMQAGARESNPTSPDGQMSYAEAGKLICHLMARLYQCSQLVCMAGKDMAEAWRGSMQQPAVDQESVPIGCPRGSCSLTLTSMLPGIFCPSSLRCTGCVRVKDMID